MQLKDYYKILEIEPSATIEEIKKAYRRLAQQYHPDKNSSKEYSLTYFTEVKEAYEVLTNPAKKDFYLQQRWYQQSLGKKGFRSQPLTPPIILKQFIELDKYVSRLDSFRMDKHGLYQYISELLNDETVEQMKAFNEQDITNEITGIAMRATSHLDLQQAKVIADKLCALSNDPATLKRIENFLQQFKKKSQWENSRIYFIVLITIIVSLLIYLGSR